MPENEDNIKNNQSEMPFTSEASLFGEPEQKNALDIFEKSKKLYLDTLNIFQDICESLRSEKETDCNALKEKIEQVIEILKEDERMLLGLASAPYSYAIRHTNRELYKPVVVHGVNLAIYSLKLLLDLSAPANRLTYLGLAAIFSHTGMLGAPSEYLSNSPDNSASLIKTGEIELNHDKYIGLVKLDNLHTESIKTLISLVKQEQQFLGSTTLTEAVHQYAMVIHICSEFEMLTHKKNYGKIITPIDAMKIMRDKMKNYFNQDIIKFFFNKLSIYPLGSYVQLSSRETAKIVGINENFIMRPIILTVLDADGMEKTPPVKINLRKKPTLYIKKAVIDETLYEKFIMQF